MNDDKKFNINYINACFASWIVLKSHAHLITYMYNPSKQSPLTMEMNYLMLNVHFRR